MDVNGRPSRFERMIGEAITLPEWSQSNFEGSAGYQQGDCGWPGACCVAYGCAARCYAIRQSALTPRRLESAYVLGRFDRRASPAGEMAAHVHFGPNQRPLCNIENAIHLLESRTCSGQLQWPDDMQCDGLHSAVAVAQPRPRWHISLCKRFASVRYTHPICMHDMTSVTSVRLRAGNQIAQHTFAWPAAP